jgi:hypothetical protein
MELRMAWPNLVEIFSVPTDRIEDESTRQKKLALQKRADEMKAVAKK